MIPYNPDEIDELDDITKQFSEYTLEKLEALKKIKAFTQFNEIAYKRIIKNIAMDEVKRITIKTSNIKKGEIVCLFALAGIPITTACKMVKLNRNTFYDLERRYRDRWKKAIDDLHEFASQESVIGGLYLIVWTTEHIKLQFNELEIDQRRRHTYINEMNKTKLDPYSTDEDTIFTYFDKLNKKTKNQYVVLKAKR